MSQEIKTIFKISQIFGKAFNQINQICAQYLGGKSIQKKTDDNTNKEKKKNNIKQLQVQRQQVKKNYSDLINKVESNSKKNQKKQNQKKGPSQNKNNKQSHPDKPKQPLSAFFLFQGDQKQNFKKAHPEFSLTQLAAVMGQIWNSLDEQEKQPYIKKHAQLKEVYQRKLKKYYQNHPEQKSKNQLKRQKQQMKKQKINEQTQEKKNVQSPKLSSKDLSKKHVILVEQQEQSEND